MPRTTTFTSQLDHFCSVKNWEPSANVLSRESSVFATLKQRALYHGKVHRVEKTHIYVFCFDFSSCMLHDCWQQTLLSIVKGVWMLFNHKLMVVYRNNGLLQLLSVSTGWTLQFSSSTTGSNSTWELPMSKLICTERLIAENSVCGFPLAFLCSFHQLYNWRDQLNYADTDMDPLSMAIIIKRN